MPRKYSMGRRNAAVDETRERIVDATVELHNEKGVAATSMQDIAARANVSLGTVYRHFPSMEALIPACGGRNLELNPLPTTAVFEGLATGEERLAALVTALYQHYERGARPYEVGLEALHIPVMANLMSELGGYLRNLVETAVAPSNPDHHDLSLAAGLCDFRVWRSLTQAGLSTAEATESVTRLIVDSLSRRETGEEGEMS